MFRPDMYDADAHSGLRQASLAARSQLRSLTHTAYGTNDPRVEVTLWAYIHGLATLVLDGSFAFGNGQGAQYFARRTIESLSFIDGVTGAQRTLSRWGEMFRTQDRIGPDNHRIS